MPTPPNYLTLTKAQEDYVRENSTKVTVETMAQVLYTSRHEILKFIMKEKLSMKINKSKKQVAQ